MDTLISVPSRQNRHRKDGGQSSLSHPSLTITSPSPGHHLVITASHPHVERPSDLSVSAIQPWLLAMMVAAAAASVALVAGPVSAWARSYVRRPSPGTASGVSDASDDGESRTPPALRHPGLLERGPQALLALTLCCWCAWWGVRAGAIGPTLVALPVHALLGCAAGVDGVAHLLPNRILGSVTAWLLACGTVAAIWQPENTHACWRALLLAAVTGVISLALALFGTGMGMGDVKLCALIGLWLGPLGWGAALSGVLAGVILAGLSALVLMAARVVGRRQMIAMGPHLIAGAWLAWILAVRAGA